MLSFGRVGILSVLSFTLLFSMQLGMPLQALALPDDDMTEVLPVEVAIPMPAELSSMLQRLNKVNGFSAKFQQSLLFSDGSEQHYRGELDVLPPGRFRWRYIEPFEQLFVSDGFTIWHYEPDLMQVRVLKEMKDVDPVVMQLLSGRIGLEDVHLLEAYPEEHRYYVRLASETRVWIGVRNGGLDYIEGKDALGNTNRISLLDMRLQAPDIGRFSFVAPEGVDVVPLH